MSAPASEALFAQAVRQHHAGHWDEAAVLYARILADEPRHADSLHLLGVLAHQRGRPDLAAESIRQAIAIQGLHAAYHADLGHALRGQGRLAEAAESYRRALHLRPDQPDLLLALGGTLLAQGAATAAVPWLLLLLERRPDSVEARVSLGNALREQGHLEQAEAQYRHALRLAPELAETHANLGVALAERGRLDEAMGCYRAALARRPAFPEVLNNLGNALRESGQVAEAVACYREAISLRPDFADAHFHLALALLAQGALAEGWREAEWRWQTPQLRAARRGFAQPQWRGEPAAGRTLLIHPEGGFGDTLQFCRYVPLAAARGLRVVLEVPAELWRLLCGLPGVAQVLAQGEALPDFDLHCPMMSLPLAMGTTLETIPAPVRYLHADAAGVAAWRHRLAARPGRLRVGLVWAGNPRPESWHLAAVDRRRSIPPALLAPLFEVEGVVLVGLQKQGPALPAGLALIDPMAEMADFADTASLVEALDLVIGVDTAVAHLAAALGRPVWLLDRFDPCWRWLEGRRDSPWYPTLRIYRQQRPGDWPAVVAAVRRDLAALAEGAAGAAFILG
jgi:tetratricopeptide (TPR) repeat protein